MAIRIALAGNPNCGKTTMFNALTGANQYVGNWPGVTVEKKEGKLKSKKVKEEVVVTDLPGIYSLSPYTLEEVVSRDYLLKENPDVIVDLVDATNIERNLYQRGNFSDVKLASFGDSHIHNPTLIRTVTFNLGYNNRASNLCITQCHGLISFPLAPLIYSIGDHQITMCRAISSFTAILESLTFTIRFPPIEDTTVISVPATNPRFSRKRLVSSFPPTFTILLTSPIVAIVKGICSTFFLLPYFRSFLRMSRLYQVHADANLTIEKFPFSIFVYPSYFQMLVSIF